MARKYPIFGLLALALVAAGVGRAGSRPSDDDYTIMRPEPGSPEARRHKAPKQEPGPKITKPAPDTAKAAPKPRKRIGSSSPVYPTPLPPPLHYNPPPVPTIVTPSRPVPPSMYVPQTGMVLPNLPAPVGSGPGGSETAQDRAMRCAHQAGVYGQAQTGNRNAYVGGCINQ